MARRSRLPIEEGIRMREAGATYEEISAALGGSASGWWQAFRKRGLIDKTVSHKEWLPWTMTKEQNESYPAHVIRHLHHLMLGNTLSDDEDTHKWLATTAFNWGHDLLEAGWDYDYDPDAEPSDFCPAGGLYLKKPESKTRWRLRRLVQAATKTQSTKLKEG